MRRAIHAVLFALLAIVLCMPLSAHTAPISRQWAPSPVLDQGNTPECVPYAFEAWQLSDPHPFTYPISTDVLWYYAKLTDGISPELGTTLTAVANTLQEHGYIGSARYVYGRYGLSWEKAWADVYQIRDFIVEHGPVIVLSEWDYGMFHTEPDGYVIPYGNNVGNHAYLCSGWTETGVDGYSLTCQSSWGTTILDQGRFKMHARDLALLLTHGAYVGLYEKANADPMFFPHLMVYRIQ